MRTKPPLSGRAQRVIEMAVRDAAERGHTHVGTEHLLLALIREGEGIAASVLISLGVEQTITEAVDFLIGRATQGPTG